MTASLGWAKIRSSSSGLEGCSSSRVGESGRWGDADRREVGSGSGVPAISSRLVVMPRPCGGCGRSEAFPFELLTGCGSNAADSVRCLELSVCARKSMPSAVRQPLKTKVSTEIDND